MRFDSNLYVRLADHMGGDESVVAAARVSVIGPQSEGYLHTPPEESQGLINFLMKNRHGTPFEHNGMTFFVQAPIAVFREFHRHRIGWSYNEESGRYKELEPHFYVPPPQRPLVQQGRPGAYEFVGGTEEHYNSATQDIKQGCRIAYSLYRNMLDYGTCKEVARGVLPVYIYSSMWVTCNARSLMHFLSLRVKSIDSTFKSFPMWEIEQVAWRLEKVFEEYFPLTYTAFVKNGRVAP